MNGTIVANGARISLSAPGCLAAAAFAMVMVLTGYWQIVESLVPVWSHSGISRHASLVCLLSLLVALIQRDRVQANSLPRSISGLPAMLGAGLVAAAARVAPVSSENLHFQLTAIARRNGRHAAADGWQPALQRLARKLQRFFRHAAGVRPPSNYSMPSTPTGRSRCTFRGCVMFDQKYESPSASTFLVKRLGEGDEKRWDAFVSAATKATFFHRVAWRDIIANELGHRCHYLYAERNGLITGVLPLAEIRSRLFGHALISTPFCVYGGVVASDPDSEARLTEAAAALAGELGVDYLELRNREPRGEGWPTKDLYVGFRKEISPDHDQNLKAIPRKQRAMVRKGISLGLQARHGASVAEFYRVYAESVRNLGTPVLSRDYYTRLQQVFGDDGEITVITDAGKPVAAVISFYFRDEVHPYYGGSVARGRELAANDFMYWALMQRAVERGARLFDFGRSKRGTGAHEFKKHWGFEPKPLPYAYHLVRSREIPNISPTNPKYGLFIKAWQRLPLPVAGMVGPLLARDLG